MADDDTNKDNLKNLDKAGSDEVQWPGDGLKKPGTIKGAQPGEKTVIPEILNDGKKYEGDKQT